MNLQEIIQIPLSVNPAPCIGFLEAYSFERQLASEKKATAICAGDGGDTFFGRASRALAAADYVRHHGFTKALFPIALSTALLTNSSIWTVLRDAVTGKTLKKRPDVVRTLLESRKLVSQDLIRSFAGVNRLPHPWFDLISQLAPGTAEMIMTLLIPYEFYDPFTRPEDLGPEEIFPLHSQPVVELCLRIPSYLHNAGGRDRAVARHAFAADLPTEITMRRWKDRGPGFYQTAIKHNLSFIRELLLDGILVQRGLLDRSQLDAALSAAPTKAAGHIGEILDHIFMEVWLQNWTMSERRAAA